MGGMIPALSGNIADLGVVPAGQFKDRGVDAIVECAPAALSEAKAPLFVENEHLIPAPALAELKGHWRTRQPPLRYALLNNAMMVRDCFIIAGNHAFYPELMPHHVVISMVKEGQLINTGDRQAGQFKFAKEETFEGVTMFLPSSSPSISHFFFEAMGHLGFFAPNAQKVLLFGPEVEAFKHLLELYGYDRPNIIFRTADRFDECWRFERLIVPLYHFGVHPHMLPVFADTATRVERDETHDLLYVSRLESTHYRLMLNEEAVARMMEKFGFKVLQLTHLGEDNKIALFRNAKVIAGPVGAGLYNVLFSKNKPTIIGLNAGRYTRSYLLNLVAVMGLDHAHFNGPEFLSYEPRHHQGTHNDFVINVAQLERVIGTFLETKL